MSTEIIDWSRLKLGSLLYQQLIVDTLAFEHDKTVNLRILYNPFKISPIGEHSLTSSIEVDQNELSIYPIDPGIITTDRFPYRAIDFPSDILQRAFGFGYYGVTFSASVHSHDQVQKIVSNPNVILVMEDSLLPEKVYYKANQRDYFSDFYSRSIKGKTISAFLNSYSVCDTTDLAQFYLEWLDDDIQFNEHIFLHSTYEQIIRTEYPNRFRTRLTFSWPIFQSDFSFSDSIHVISPNQGVLWVDFHTLYEYCRKIDLRYFEFVPFDESMPEWLRVPFQGIPASYPEEWSKCDNKVLETIFYLGGDGQEIDNVIKNNRAAFPPRIRYLLSVSDSSMFQREMVVLKPLLLCADLIPIPVYETSLDSIVMKNECDDNVAITDNLQMNVVSSDSVEILLNFFQLSRVILLTSVKSISIQDRRKR
ncbi:MAG: hypothetical protein V2A70_08425, partial [Candidatus Omnitrophota bacterium]